MSWRHYTLLLFLIVAACGCRFQRGVTAHDVSHGEISVGPIDWDESAGLFIGIEKFHAADAPRDVSYAADDATDLAYLFTNELRLLPPAQTVVMVSGRPSKEHSREHLDELGRQARVVLDDVDAAHVYKEIEQQVAHVGTHGVFVLSIATHGYTAGGQHVLLTAESGAVKPQGVVLGKILRQQQRGRLLLFVDACRERLAEPPLPASPSSMSEAFFEDLQGARAYAVFSASAPGGFAQSDDTARNGFFTGSLIEAFRRLAGAASDGCALTLGALASEVSGRVLARSGGRQKPEARFGGGITDLCIVDGGSEKTGEIVFPPQGATVTTSGDVAFRALRPGLFASVLLCAARNGVCYNQSPAPVPAPAQKISRMHVQYGTPDRFDIYVALSANRSFSTVSAKPPARHSIAPHTTSSIGWDP